MSAKTLDVLGMPQVDYDSLHRYYTDDLKIPFDQSPRLKLVGRREDSLLHGTQVAFTRTIYVHAPTAENMYWRSGGVMHVVAHEGQHFADAKNRKFWFGAWLAVRIGAVIVPQMTITGITNSSLLGLGAGVVSLHVYNQRYDPLEKSARRAAELLESFESHWGDIVFPESARAVSGPTSTRG